MIQWVGPGLECSRDWGREGLVSAGPGKRGARRRMQYISVCLAGAVVCIYRGNHRGEAGWVHNESETGSC